MTPPIKRSRVFCGAFSLFAPFSGLTYYLWAQIHPFPISRKHTTAWGRFLKNVVFKRALNYFSLRANSLFLLMPFGISGAKTKIVISVFANNILIINCAFQNRYFGLAHSICRILATWAGEVARFNNTRAPKASRNEGRALNFAKICFVSSKQILWTEYSLAQAKPRFCVSAPQFANTFAFAGKVKPRDFVICVRLIIARRGKLRRSAAKAACRGVVLQSRKFVLSAQNKFREPLKIS